MVQKIVSDIYERYPEFYQDFNIGMLAVKILSAKLENEIQNWNILEEGLKYFDLFYEIRNILATGRHNSFQDVYDNFSHHNDADSESQNEELVYFIFNTYWLHPVRNYISISWKVKEECMSLVSMLGHWTKLMPSKFFAKMVEVYLKPRLRREIEDNWNPKDISEVNQIQNWLLPWRNLLGDKEMQGFFVQIRIKLTSSLNDWKPESEVARIVLAPWKDILDSKSFEGLLNRLILPKLSCEAQNMEIDPSDQNIQPLKNIVVWSKIILPSTLAQLLRDHVMSKWIQTLLDWFQMVTEDKDASVEDNYQAFQEIYGWYLGWKQELPESVRTQPKLEEILKLALHLIDSKIE